MDYIERAVMIEMGQRSFWYYEQALFPDFFKDDRPHLEKLANTLQELYEGKLLDKEGNVLRRLMINMPPRHGKSFTLMLFSTWLMGKDQTNKVITVSYNQTLSSQFSKGVRDSIVTESIDSNKIFFEDVFPEAEIKYGDASAQKWALEGQYFNYLGTGMGGTITGIGCNIGMIDDPVKNSIEAFNDAALTKHWDFYKDTFLSRLESGSIQIINMTRWANDDLCGKLLELQPEKWHIMKMEAYDKVTNTMLCESLLSRVDYEEKKSVTSPPIFQANYHQEPVDEIGRMYKSFRTYKDIPEGGIRRNHTDTADDGSDYLCSINYKEVDSEVYITGIIYTKDSMEITEPLLAEMLIKDDIRKAVVESNNGGKGFARAVKELLKKLGHKTTVIKWAHQSTNKESRILNSAHWIQEHVYYPEDWGNRWSEYYKAMTSFKREGKNKNDDAPDCTTGVAEQVSKPKRIFS